MLPSVGSIIITPAKIILFNYTCRKILGWIFSCTLNNYKIIFFIVF